MRSLFVLGLLLLASTVSAQTTPAPKPAQPTPAPAPKPAQPAPAAPAPKPAQTAPRPAPRPAAAARAGIAITVTDSQGLTLSDVHVEIVGVSDRTGDTNPSGQVNFTLMQAGTYRLRFSGERVVTFEKEVTLRAGQIADLDVMLSAAPPPPPPPPPAPEPPPVVPSAPTSGPPGQPLTTSIVALIEKELIPGNLPRRDSLVSCSGNTRTTLVQLNQDQAERLYDTADVTYYVVAGEGAVRLAGRDTKLTAGSFISVPRGSAHSIVRGGRRPLILLTTLSGTPCEEPR